jgi:hypothetical protein
VRQRRHGRLHGDFQEEAGADKDREQCGAVVSSAQGLGEGGRRLSARPRSQGAFLRLGSRVRPAKRQRHSAFLTSSVYLLLQHPRRACKGLVCDRQLQTPVLLACCVGWRPWLIPRPGQAISWTGCPTAGEFRPRLLPVPEQPRHLRPLLIAPFGSLSTKPACILSQVSLVVAPQLHLQAWRWHERG